MTDAAALPDRPGLMLTMEKMISHGRNGLLVDLHDVGGIADAVAGALAVPEQFGLLRRVGHKTVRARFGLCWVACRPCWSW